MLTDVARPRADILGCIDYQVTSVDLFSEPFELEEEETGPEGRMEINSYLAPCMFPELLHSVPEGGPVTYCLMQAKNAIGFLRSFAGPGGRRCRWARRRWKHARARKKVWMSA